MCTALCVVADTFIVVAVESPACSPHRDSSNHLNLHYLRHPSPQFSDWTGFFLGIFQNILHWEAFALCTAAGCVCYSDAAGCRAGTQTTSAPSMQENREKRKRTGKPNMCQSELLTLLSITLLWFLQSDVFSVRLSAPVKASQMAGDTSFQVDSWSVSSAEASKQELRHQTKTFQLFNLWFITFTFNYLKSWTCLLRWRTFFKLVSTWLTYFDWIKWKILNINRPFFK